MVVAFLAALFAGLALLLLIATAASLRRRRLLRAGTAGLGAGCFVVLAAFSLSLAVNLHTYARLTSEQPVAQLRFEQRDAQRFAVEMRASDGSVRRVEVAGDEWQLDARVLKWSGMARLLGLDPLFRLERLSGRYHDTAQELNSPRTVHPLAEPRGYDVWATVRGSGWVPWVDALYGSATYLPMRDGAEYQVSIAASGLVARPANAIAEQAVSGWN